jgi:hypothetical protein
MSSVRNMMIVSRSCVTRRSSAADKNRPSRVRSPARDAALDAPSTKLRTPGRRPVSWLDPKLGQVLQDLLAMQDDDPAAAG